MPATIHLVRHAQGYHNLPREKGGPDPHMLSDPELTELGKQQCADLCASFPHHDKITHLVASPIRRTVYTALLSFRPAVDAGKAVKALPEVQEVSSLPCDTGSAPDVLAREFDSKLDLALVKDGWNDKSPSSPFAPQLSKLKARSRAARVWLRDLAARFGGDPHIVVVTHGGILHFLNQDWDGMTKEAGTGWKNTEWRSYEFVDASGEDPDAKLRETSASWERRRGSAAPLSETELEELAAAHMDEMQEELDRVEVLRQAREAESKKHSG
ncbi:phosphoglycerate mutase [Gaeumannomyces tritici R3-111a-1]|uniref:Phosphoglycerate mutase n=1 Tax=Gaeumannomyces tritici (strain R3-111a-1) TaxID=644352 RepID=J3NH98_GAET3|nr:phosphoglycerate mutase [Gaeumannomyces tritici R3-111a-1]EJT80641.1 phosphoglycerate mutase [Gaeumannomyces tritici R3-111a-1]